MKLSKKVGLIMGAGVIVVLLCIVLVVYFQQVAERRDLNNQLDSATALSNSLEADKEDLGFDTRSRLHRTGTRATQRAPAGRGRRSAVDEARRALLRLQRRDPVARGATVPGPDHELPN